MAVFDHIAAELPGVRAASAIHTVKASNADPRDSTSGGCATLLMLGLKDRRVPPSQGMEAYHALRARLAQAQGRVQDLDQKKEGKDGQQKGEDGLYGWRSLRLLTFPDDVHALDKASTESEAWPAIAAWLHAVLRM
jgi:hypothetical protein